MRGAPTRLASGIRGADDQGRPDHRRRGVLWLVAPAQGASGCVRSSPEELTRRARGAQRFEQATLNCSRSLAVVWLRPELGFEVTTAAMAVLPAACRMAPSDHHVERGRA